MTASSCRQSGRWSRRFVFTAARAVTADFMAPTPAGQEPGSPFGPSIEALAVYLRYYHAIGFELGLSAVPGGRDDQRVDVAAGSR